MPIILNVRCTVLTVLSIWTGRPGHSFDTDQPAPKGAA